jgi:hypothetical protein
LPEEHAVTNQPGSLSLKLFAAGLMAVALAVGPDVAFGSGGAPAPAGGGGAFAPRTPRGPTASQTARVQLDNATAQLNAANTALNRVRSRVELSFKTLPEWQAAQKEYDKAKADLDLATKAVMAKLKVRADYKAASTAWATADGKARKLAEDPKANQVELDALAQERAAQVIVLRNLEKEALDNDLKVLEARQRMADAQAKIASFKGQVDAAAAQDPEYQTAWQQVQAAQQQVQAAKQQLIEAQRSDAAAKAAEAKAKADAAKAKSGSRGSSGGGVGGY